MPFNKITLGRPMLCGDIKVISPPVRSWRFAVPLAGCSPGGGCCLSVRSVSSLSEANEGYCLRHTHETSRSTPITIVLKRKVEFCLQIIKTNQKKTTPQVLLASLFASLIADYFQYLYKLSMELIRFGFGTFCVLKHSRSCSHWLCKPLLYQQKYS